MSSDADHPADAPSAGGRGEHHRLRAGRRTALAAAALAALIGCGADEDADEPLRPARANLTLEQFRQVDSGRPELLVSLPQTRLNDPDLTGGERSVLLRCSDARGATLIRARTQWPLLEEAGYPLPHIHQPARPAVLRRVRRCTLTGAGVGFEGRVPGPPPVAAQR